ncbi:hydroxymethylbilane synthase [Longimicrobium terrae]|uniref:hydroxymethylbilane synthase n=1 Tax=Longimicrobium terrae TaxID=1639882 RepID=UPI0017C73DD4|nr:hydroxymethylbilane synthase [Longimicrobium terrae]
MIRIASRGSELALWQSRAVAGSLRAADPSLQVEIEVIRTTGDRIQDVPLAKIGDKGLFTKELDNALLEDQADLAVHSLKDIPTRLPDGLTLAAVTVREDPRDVVLLPPGQAGGLEALEPGARVGTSSLRRVAQLRKRRPDLELVDLRGNLNTRLAKLDRGEYDAIILAAAGVLRLGWRDRISAYLEPPRWLPAVGQGALGIVCRTDRDDIRAALAPLNDPDTAAATTAERALLRALEGGCQIPIGALGLVDEGQVYLAGLVADTDGSRILRVHQVGDVKHAAAVGRAAADELLAKGAGEILASVRARVVLAEPAAP